MRITHGIPKGTGFSFTQIHLSDRMEVDMDKLEAATNIANILQEHCKIPAVDAVSRTLKAMDGFGPSFTNQEINALTLAVSRYRRKWQVPQNHEMASPEAAKQLGYH